MNDILRTHQGRLWFLELDKQLTGTRSVSLGGILAKYMRSNDISDEEMKQQEKTSFDHIIADIRYDWLTKEGCFFRTKILSKQETLWWNLQEKKIKN
jgi:hypothetical protein